MLPVGFEPTISAGERLRTYALGPVFCWLQYVIPSCTSLSHEQRIKLDFIMYITYACFSLSD